MAKMYVLPDPEYPGKCMGRIGAWPTVDIADKRNSDITSLAGSPITHGDEIIIGSGVYSALMLGPSNYVLVNKQLTYRPPQVGDADYPINAGDVILDGGTLESRIMYVQYSGVTTKNLKFVGIIPTGSAVAQLDLHTTATGFVGDDLEFSGGRQAILIRAVATFNRPVFNGIGDNALGNTGMIEVQATGAGTVLNFPIIKKCVRDSAEVAAIYASGNCTINHPVFTRCSGPAVKVVSGDTVVNNPIIFSVSEKHGYPLKQQTAGTITVNNPVLSGATSQWGYIATGSVTINNPTYTSPRFVTPNRPSLLMFCIDDISNLAVFHSLAEKLESYGWVGCFALNYASTVTPEQWDTIADLASRGHCIACHSENFSDNIADLLGLSIAYSGAGVATCSINNVGLGATNITVNIDGSPAVSVDIDSSTTLADVVSVINAHADLSSVKTNPDSSLDIAAKYLSTADTVSLSAVATEFSLDTEQVYDDQVTNPKSIIEAEIRARGVTNYVCDSWVCPGNQTNDTLRSALKTRGFTAARGESLLAGNSTNAVMASTLNIMGTPVESICGSADPTQDTVNINIIGLIGAMQSRGYAYTLVGHTESHFSLDGWDKVLKAINDCNHINVVTFSEAAEFIRTYDPSGDLETTDGVNYTRTFLDEIDVRLDQSSLAVHGGLVIAGVNDGAQLDPWGNTMLDYPNIGADQEDYAPGFGPYAKFSGNMPTLTREPSSSLVVDGAYVWSRLPTDAELARAFGGV